jgi:putative membrane protein
MYSKETSYPLKPNTRWQNVIIVTSVLVPIVVAILIYLPSSARINLLDVSFLPHLNAILNTATAICLAISLIAILDEKVKIHKLANTSAFFISALFLVSYITYHYTAAPTVFGDTDHNGILSEAERVAAGSSRTLYVGVLLSHILLAAIVLPFVLFSMFYSLSGQIERHKRLSRITWPIWFYVAVSGVIVYGMISPFYNH